MTEPPAVLVRSRAKSGLKVTFTVPFWSTVRTERFSSGRLVDTLVATYRMRGVVFASANGTVNE